jgi:hypothetical protein
MQMNSDGISLINFRRIIEPLVRPVYSYCIGDLIHRRQLYTLINSVQDLKIFCLHRVCHYSVIH